MTETRVRRVITEDLSNVEFETSEDVEVISTFDTMGLREELLRGIYAYGTYKRKDVLFIILNLNKEILFCRFLILVAFCRLLCFIEAGL